MSAPVTPMTELDAVNLMLSIIGEAPVSSLENTGVVDAITATNLLRTVSRQVQSKGWHCNTDVNRKLVPTVGTGYILLPHNTLRVDTTGTSKNVDVAQRGDKLWDRVNHTFTFDGPLYVDLVVGLPFDQLPEAFRDYISIRAGRMFQDRHLGSETLSMFAERDEMRAWAMLLDFEADTADYNMLGDWSVARVLAR